MYLLIFCIVPFSGVHHNKKGVQCYGLSAVKKVQTMLKQSNPYLYPKNLTVDIVEPKAQSYKGYRI